MNNFKLDLNEQEVNLVLQALGEMPAKLSMTLIMKLQQQAQAQVQVQKPEMKVVDKKPFEK